MCYTCTHVMFIFWTCLNFFYHISSDGWQILVHAGPYEPLVRWFDLQTCEIWLFSIFIYLFFPLEAAVRAFRTYRPVIVTDATHLKGTYRGVLLVASTKDVNEQIVPLAFGIGDKENDSSWIWFLDHVRKSLGTPDNLLIVSDQHWSIKNAVQFVFLGKKLRFLTW